MKIRRGVKSAVICGALGTGLSSLLAGCASVTAIPLEADGLNVVPGAQPGFRYYIPRPYLLVAEAPPARGPSGPSIANGQSENTGTQCTLPPPAPPTQKAPCDQVKALVEAGKAMKAKEDAADAENKKKDAAAAAVVAPEEKKKEAVALAEKAAADAEEKKKAFNAAKTDADTAARMVGAAAATPSSTTKGATGPATSPGTDGGESKTASASAADISFQFGDGKTYIAKLVYLPDYSRPMAVELNTGLVGISHVDMTLQDGWMLTSVSANADNSKMGDVLTAAIQALSTSASGGATKAASTAAKTTGKGVGGQPAPGERAAPKDRSLIPGLYAFDYAYGMSRVWGLCAITYFGPSGSVPATGRGACGPDYSRPMPPPIAVRY